MFGISSFELLVILLVGVIVLGPERLPKILRLASRAASELRRLTTDLQRSINLEAHLHEHNASLKEQARDLFF
ncbi:MAG: twin-arginine translocase TatA/TatE family subunit, partial [Deltaproteobacteria bacterium]|nr:twin-arginine translocase TatA/TatE family subunit [Deltaproteobacteria bacterium]